MKTDIRVLKDLCRGRWDAIFASLAPSLKTAMEANGKHVPCPVRGGQDGFRLYEDWRDTGGSVSNAEGSLTDGIATIMFCNGWTFGETVKQINRFLNPNREATSRIVRSDDPAFIGKVSQIGYVSLKGKQVFRLTVSAEPDGESKTIWGKRVYSEVQLKQIKQEDRICVQHFADSISSTNGKEYRTRLWRIERLQSKEEMKKQRIAEEKERRYLALAIEKQWMRGVAPKEDSPVWIYLRNRGIDPSSNAVQNNIRESFSFMEGEKRPVMLAAVRTEDGKLVTLHRTFLTKEGRKADLPTPKMLMKLPKGRSINGASVGFGETSRSIVAVTEGIETALSVAQGTGYPCFAAISANGLISFNAPKTAKVVCIFADKDVSKVGQKAAEELRSRLVSEGYHAVVLFPFESIPEGSKGIDWNDVLVNGGYFPLKRI